jgi:hypothetical protein
MDRRSGWRGFTVTEALFLILVLIFAVAVLMPMLARVRVVPNQATCGVRLGSIGKTMLIYANDYGGEFPRAGARDCSWTARTPNWLGRDRQEAFGIGSDGMGGQASISASLYLLVKYTEAVPKWFLCIDHDGNMEKGTSEFRPAAYGRESGKLTDFWDFGPNPPRHCSYAYHMVYGLHRLTISHEPGMPIAADRNPWMDALSAKAKDFSLFAPNAPPFFGTPEQSRHGNAASHQEHGQNVLFQDTHVQFEKRSYCGVGDDNIYTSWDGTDKLRGRPPKLGSRPADANDSLLVNDPPAVRK